MSKPNVNLKEALKVAPKPIPKRRVITTSYVPKHREERGIEKALPKPVKVIRVGQDERTPKTPIKKISEPPPPFQFLDYKGLRDYGKIRVFVDWCALSQDDRKPKTQHEFAKLIGVNPDTLSDWKKRRGFFDEVDTLRDQWFRKYITDLDYAMVKAALKGNPKAAELFYKRYGYLVEKNIVEQPDYDEKEDAVTRIALTNIGINEEVMRMLKR